LIYEVWSFTSLLTGCISRSVHPSLENEGQGFIYKPLVEGETLQERWGNMNERERLAVCIEMKSMAKAWRTLRQDGQQPYLGKRTYLEYLVSTHLIRSSIQQVPSSGWFVLYVRRAMW
jgi:hypothetical protein